MQATTLLIHKNKNWKELYSVSIHSKRNVSERCSAEKGTKLLLVLADIWDTNWQIWKFVRVPKWTGNWPQHNRGWCYCWTLHNRWWLTPAQGCCRIYAGRQSLTTSRLSGWACASVTDTSQTCQEENGQRQFICPLNAKGDAFNYQCYASVLHWLCREVGWDMPRRWQWQLVCEVSLTPSEPYHYKCPAPKRSRLTRESKTGTNYFRV